MEINVSPVRRRECASPSQHCLSFCRDESFLSSGPPVREAAPCVLPVTLIGMDGWREDEATWLGLSPLPAPPQVGNLSFYLFAHSIHSETTVGIVLSMLNMIRPCQETQVLEPAMDLSHMRGQDLSSPSRQMNDSQ